MCDSPCVCVVKAITSFSRDAQKIYVIPQLKFGPNLFFCPYDLKDLHFLALKEIWQTFFAQAIFNLNFYLLTANKLF